MDCKQCGESGAERMEVQFVSDANVGMYLCPSCADSLRNDNEIKDIRPLAT